MNAAPPAPQSPCRILALDGGGAKGFYTLGVLKELETAIGGPLRKHFDFIFGTSSGAIISALIGLGKTLDEIHTLYKDHVPSVMKGRSSSDKSAALKTLADKIFQSSKFDVFPPGIGIVATRWDFERPMIFKSKATQAHGQGASFVPGFGCTISDAVQASCSAYPFFERKVVVTGKGDRVELIDGGFAANNPTLYAIADALGKHKRAPGDLRVLSVGVGMYPEPKRSFIERWKRNTWPAQLLQKTLDVNTISMEQLRKILFPDIRAVRVNDKFEKPEMATDLIEHDLTKLNMLFQRGVDSFGAQEADILSLFHQ